MIDFYAVSQTIYSGNDKTINVAKQQFMTFE